MNNNGKKNQKLKLYQLDEKNLSLKQMREIQGGGKIVENSSNEGYQRIIENLSDEVQRRRTE